jgi:hypothetical protein
MTRELSNKTRALVLISASLEAGTGLALLAVPNLVANVLLSTGLGSAGKAVARVGGLGLISLAFACWPEGDRNQSVRALFFYNLMAAGYLGYLRISGEFTSSLLLPACGLHGLLGLLFAAPAYRTVADQDSVM